MEVGQLILRWLFIRGQPLVDEVESFFSSGSSSCRAGMFGGSDSAVSVDGANKPCDEDCSASLGWGVSTASGGSSMILTLIEQGECVQHVDQGYEGQLLLHSRILLRIGKLLLITLLTTKVITVS